MNPFADPSVRSHVRITGGDLGIVEGEWKGKQKAIWGKLKSCRGALDLRHKSFQDE